MKTKIKIFKSLFKGREDIFAVRWESGKKSGYMPAYSYDPYMYRLHKMKGGSFQNYSDKSYQPLTDEQIAKHLDGEQFIGIYPLLKDNTSWFLAADFDKENWIEESRTFINCCVENSIPAYLERSRSGRGGHVWIFFEQPYPAVRSRKIFLSILEQSGAFSMFDKNSSFDRLFPNQDQLSGKGFGNLIALPLHKGYMKEGNTCFIDVDSSKPIEDQWTFLRGIRKVPVSVLDNLFEYYTKRRAEKIPVYLESRQSDSGIPAKLTITLSNNIRISRTGLTMPLVNFLKEELNFFNVEYAVKKNLNRNVWGTERYFRFIDETDDAIFIPRGMAGKLLSFCKEHDIEYHFNDIRQKLEPVSFVCSVELRKHQIIAVEATLNKNFGVIVAPPGTGKTVIALKIIAEKQQPALIVVHRKQIAEQWIERIQTFLGITKSEIGKIGQGKIKTGKQITVALIQTLSKALEDKEKDDITNKFGAIIIDECHHIPAKTYRDTISRLSTYYLYGLTATPFRKYNDGRLIFINIGKLIAEIKPQEVTDHKIAKVIVCNTELNVPYNSKTDPFEILSKILIHDSNRNKLITDSIYWQGSALRSDTCHLRLQRLQD